MVFPALLDLGLEAEGLDGQRVVGRLGHHRGLGGHRLEALVEKLLLRLVREEGQQHEQRHDDEQHHAQAHVDEELRGDEDEDEGEVGERHRRRAGEELAQGFELAQTFGDHTGRCRFEMAERHPHKFMHHFAADQRVEPRAAVAGDIAAQRAQHRFEGVEHDHADGEDGQRVERLLADDLIIDCHREDRRAEGEEVDDQRGDADLDQRGAHAVGDQRAPVGEALAGVGYGSDKQRAFGPVEQRAALGRLGVGAVGVEQREFVFAPLGHHFGAAVLAEDDEGQRQGFERFAGQRAAADLVAETAGGAHKIVDRHAAARHRRRATNLGEASLFSEQHADARKAKQQGVRLGGLGGGFRLFGVRTRAGQRQRGDDVARADCSRAFVRHVLLTHFAPLNGRPT